jgi:PAS domain S-box-containing protein
MEYVDKGGTFKGIATDYLRNIEEKLGIRFEIARNQPWHKLINMAKKRDIDMFSCLAKTSERSKYLSFSSAYATSPVVIFSRTDMPYIGDLIGLEGKKVAVVKGYAIHEILARKHPGITLVPVSNIHEALVLLESGDVYAYVGSLVVTSYNISEQGHSLVKVAGKTPYELALGMASRNDWPVFARILQKSIDSISEKERNEINRKWFSVTYEHSFDYSLVWKILIGAGSVLIILFFWNRRLKRQVGRKTAELVSSEKRLKAIFNHRFQLTALLRPDGKLLIANENVCNMVGVGFKGIEGKYLWELPHWSHSEEMQRQVQDGIESAQKGNLVQFETTHLDSEGNIHYIEFSLTPVRNEKGEVIYIVPEGHDTTTKKQAENRLIESERNYREIYNSSSDAIFLHDSETGHIIDVNQTMLEMFGYTYEEALQLELGDISSGEPPYTQKEAIKKLKKALNEGPQLFEWAVCHKDGSCFWIEVSLRSTTIGGKGRVLAVVRDISERKLLDNELRLVKHSVEHSAYPFEWIQKDARFFYVNDATCLSLGYTSEELCSMYVSDIDPDFPIETWPGFWDKLKEEKTLTFESRHLKKTGEIFHVEITANHLEFEGKEHVFAYVKDISEKVQYEVKQKNLEKQLQHAYKMEAIGTLAGGIAHDFNNILSGILGYAELSKMSSSTDKKLLGFLDNIMAAGNRAKDLVQQILTFSRQTDHNLTTVSIKNILKEALKLLRASLPSTIEIKQNMKSNSLILGDPTQVHQIIMNLCTNSGHAMQESGGILEIDLLNVEHDAGNISQYPDLEFGSYVLLTVSDTGHGIPPEVLEQIFNPFFTTKEKGEGTGMGLAVVHGIVKSYGGAIYVHSESGEGSNFEVFLPSIKSKSEPAYDTQAIFPEGTEHILYVDDEPTLLEIGEKMLEGLGYKVFTRTSSIEALEFFRAQPDRFDLVITDLTMPKLTGDKLAGELVAIRKDIPIILCTGFSNRLTEDKIDSIGIKGILMKPVIRTDLAQMVRKVLDETKANTQP